jgi:hypothetical protein
VRRKCERCNRSKSGRHAAMDGASTRRLLETALIGKRSAGSPRVVALCLPIPVDNSPSIQQSRTNTPTLKRIPLLRVDGRPLGEWPRRRHGPRGLPFLSINPPFAPANNHAAFDAESPSLLCSTPSKSLRRIQSTK